jgi:hypothetical protein
LMILIPAAFIFLLHFRLLASSNRAFSSTNTVTFFHSLLRLSMHLQFENLLQHDKV